MDKRAMWNEMIGVIKQDVTPATGCTEPIALAYAAATAARELGEPVRFVDGWVSANLMKNGMASPCRERGYRACTSLQPSEPSAVMPKRDCRSSKP